MEIQRYKIRTERDDGHMTEKVWYSVWPERGNLVRFTESKAELYCPGADGSENWVGMPHLNEIRYGLGNAVWYDEVKSGEELKYWMKKIREGDTGS